MDLNSKLADLLDQAKMSLSAQQIQNLVAYVELLHKWNRAYNLTSIRQPEDMLVKHILDSLAVGPHVSGQRLIDVGTGPGLPGIPLAIMYPEKEFVLLDSLGKRITFLRQVVYQLGLKNVTPVKARVEEFQPEIPFDGVLSRAFASLHDMVSWCQHLIDSNGRFYALKGQYPESEITDLPEKIELVSSVQINVPNLEGERHLLELKKNS